MSIRKFRSQILAKETGASCMLSKLQQLKGFNDSSARMLAWVLWD